MIKINKKDNPNLFAGVYWASSIVYEDPTGKGLSLLKLEVDDKGTKWIGCDSYRLHIFRHSRSQFESGLYRITTITESKILLDKRNSSAYPDYDAAIPSPDSIKVSVTLETDLLESNHKQCTDYLEQGYSLDVLLFEQLTAIPLPNFKIRISNSSLVILKKKGYFGLLAPRKFIK